MYDNTDAAHAPWRDCAFALHGARLEAHRGVLAARCPYLARRFPAGGLVQLPAARFPAVSLAAVLRWCYTARLACPAAAATATAALLVQTRLPELADALRAEAADAPPRQQTLALEPPRAAAKAELQADFAALADACSDADADAAALPASRVAELRAGAARVCVGDETFWAHAGFLCPRSDFFAALMGARWRGDAGDAQQPPPPLVLHDVSPAAFRLALRWAYTGACPEGRSCAHKQRAC